jgi:hypothetical protein
MAEQKAERVEDLFDGRWALFERPLSMQRS